MIHGKFFTGLPESMLGRTKGPDRQKSSLFWPDESETVPVTENKNKLTPRNNTKQNNRVPVDQMMGVSSAEPSEPKEFFKKELTSKIDFFDMFDTLQPDKNKNVAPLNNKKHETFSSKIEFYDFMDGTTPQPSKVDRNSKTEIEKYSQNSPKTYEKRITFIDNKPQNNSQTPKSILKNNEIVTKIKSNVSSNNQNNLKKKNISKPVENLSRSKSAPNIADSDVHIIENDVKHITLNNDVDEVLENSFAIEQQEISQQNSNGHSQQKTVVTNHHIDTSSYDTRINNNADEDYYSNVTQKTNSYPKRQTHEIEIEYEQTHDDWNDNGNVNRNLNHKSKVNNESHLEPEIYSTPKRNSPPKLRPGVYRGQYMDVESRNNDSREIYHKIHTEHTNDQHDSSSKNQNSQSNYCRSPETAEQLESTQNFETAKCNKKSVPNQPAHRQRAHRHLVSNISFGNDTEPNENIGGQRRSIRNRAVTRSEYN